MGLFLFEGTVFGGGSDGNQLENHHFPILLHTHSGFLCVFLATTKQSLPFGFPLATNQKRVQHSEKPPIRCPVAQDRFFSWREEQTRRSGFPMWKVSYFTATHPKSVSLFCFAPRSGQVGDGLLGSPRSARDTDSFRRAFPGTNGLAD